MKKGQEVVLIKSVYSHVRHKMVKIGTKGTILGVRHLSGRDKEALVKFKGYQLPIGVTQDVIN